MFSDIEGSTRILQEIGDEAYRQLLEQHHQVIRDSLAGEAGSRCRPRVTRSLQSS